MVSQKSNFSLFIGFLIIGFCICQFLYTPSVSAAETEWQMVSGPTIIVQAIIKPYINITINSPATIQSNISTEGPTVIFDCNRGPGVYQASYPLTFSISSNSAFQLQFEASKLKEKNSDATISPERLSVRFNDPGKTKNTFSSFQEGVKKIVFETTKSGVAFTTECDFQLEITYEDRAGTYEGAIFVEVLYQP